MAEDRRLSVVLVNSKRTTAYAFGSIREQFGTVLGTVEYHGQPLTQLTSGIYEMDNTGISREGFEYIRRDIDGKHGGKKIRIRVDSEL